MFRNFVTRNFPFLEDDFDALTDYQLFCKFIAYVKKLNIKSDELKKQVEELEEYVKNLDIQDAVNNKIDEMWENGDFNDIIAYFTGTTLLNIVEELPDDQVDNTQYEVINSENNLDITLPTSYYENLYNLKTLTTENQLNDLLKVGTFNIENEDVPYTDGVDGIKKLTRLQNIYNKLGCNILGLNEAFDSLDYPANYYMTTEYLTHYNQVTTWENIIPNMNYGEGILSHLAPLTQSTKIYTSYHSPEHQGYVKNTYNYNGNIISFYCTHLCYNDETTLRNQLGELYLDVTADSSTYKIIVGDFNFDLSESSDYLASFLSDDYKLVNGGQYKTYDDERNLAIDEIMVSGNIDIVSSGVGNRAYIEGLSDHFPVYATLEFK